MTWQPKNLTREQQAERRAEAVGLLKAGEMKQVEIARYLGVTEAAVSKRKRKLAEEGPGGLQLRKSSGRPPRLDKTAKQMLVKKLEEGAVAAGFPTEQWTQARVKKVIEREFGVRYHQNYISQLLKDLGWSVQKSEPRAIERDEDLIRAWLSRDWPRIKKARRLGAEIVFEDEFGFSYARSRAHKANLVKAFLEKHPNIHVEYLPAYAPELNPEEYCHGNVKRRMKNAILHSKNEIRNPLDQGFSRLRKRPDILFGCFQHAGLTLNRLW
jgi:transposase